MTKFSSELTVKVNNNAPGMTMHDVFRNGVEIETIFEHTDGTFTIEDDHAHTCDTYKSLDAAMAVVAKYEITMCEELFGKVA